MDFINGACCKQLKVWIQDAYCPFNYQPSLRLYIISQPPNTLTKNAICMGFDVLYCPLCAANLPSDLIDTRMELLKKLYGINEPYDPEQKQKIPAEFNTDEWWKKRGLDRSQDDAAQQLVSIVSRRSRQPRKKTTFHCCETLKLLVEDTICPLDYTPLVRSYWLSVPKRLIIPKRLKKTHADWPVYKIKYCINCGTELPCDLTEIRLKILKNEYGITDVSDPVQAQRIPKEFMTDKWWKERGL